MTQSEALTILKTGANVFLTGEPGSGKTYTVNQFVAWLRERGVEPAITASTGIAATHIGGFTIHSWSGIGVRRSLSEYDLDHISSNERVARRVRNAKVLIIDEVSMLSAATFSMVDVVCREIRRETAPFGGLQVVLVGDFFQLPPIVRRETELEDAVRQEGFGSLGGDGGAGLFAFSSDSWRKLNPLLCYLSEQHRQEDPAFLDFLSAVRRGTLESRHRALLETRRASAALEGVTQLYSHNADVDRINTTELSKLSGSERTFEMSSRGSDVLVAQLKRGCLSPERLQLKIAARVMCTKNNIAEHFVNGTTGAVTAFSKESGLPIVELRSGRRIEVEPMDWPIEAEGRTLAKITQVPLRLAWAITVHKSQGMSLDAAHMDLSDAFEYGQGYVALSRVRTLAGLSLAGVNERALEIHPDIRAKDAEFREHSRDAREAWSELSPSELDAMQKNFIRASGGTWVNEGDTKAVPRASRPQKKNTVITTLEIIQRDGLIDITALAKARDLTEGTVIEHFEKLRALGHISPHELTRFARGKERLIERAHQAFRRVGAERLKPVFDLLGGSIPYPTLRLARLLYNGESSSDDE